MKNPILKGFYPDPSICRVGEDYYLVCSSFEYFPGVPIFHSRDLENWTQIGNVLDRESQLPLTGVGSSHGVWAPTIRYWNGRFYMIVSCYGHGAHTLLVTAENPAGPWSEPIEIATPAGSIDPSLMFDDDGKCYLTVNHNRQWQIDPETGKLLSEMQIIWEGSGGGFVESPHLYHIGDYYYLLDAEGGTGRTHLSAIGRSKSPWGPFEGCPHNPILTSRGSDRTSVQCCGHGDLVDDGKGNWYIVFLGIREVPGKFPRVHHAGRETFIAPVDWVDGWPVVNGGEPIMAGEVEEFSIADDFSERRLDWLELRNPTPGAVRFARHDLRLTGNGMTINDPAGNPAVLLHRLPDLDFIFTTELNESRGCAGLTLLMDEEHHYDWYPDGSEWVLRRRIGDLREERRFQSVGKTAGIEFHPDGITFFVCDDAGKRTVAEKVAARYLSTEVAGGFTGLMVGFFADGDGILSVHSAEFRCMSSVRRTK